MRKTPRVSPMASLFRRWVRAISRRRTPMEAPTFTLVRKHLKANKATGSRPCRVNDTAVGVIQAPKLEPRIMRYELSDYEWTAIKPMLPNKPRGVRRDRR